MAVDMFLNIEGEIEGESKDKEHTNEIDILQWSFGLENSGSFHTGAGGGSGKSKFHDITITKHIDSASAKLMLYCANGDHFKEATLTVRKAGKTALEYIVVKMGNVMVTSINTGGSGGDDLLSEQISLNFENFEVKYTPQKEDGQAGKPQEFKWDIGANSAK